MLLLLLQELGSILNIAFALFFFILGAYILQGFGKAKYQKVKVLSEVKRKFRTKPRAGILGPLYDHIQNTSKQVAEAVQSKLGRKELFYFHLTMSISNVLYIQIEVANFPIIKDFLHFPMLHLEKDLELRS